MNQYTVMFLSVILVIWILVLWPPAWYLKLFTHCRDTHFICLFAISFVVTFIDVDIPNFFRFSAFIVLAFSFLGPYWTKCSRIKGENFKRQDGAYM